MYYRIVGIFGEDFNLAVWRIFQKSPIIKPNVMHTTHVRIYYLRYIHVRLKQYGAVRVFQERRTYTSHSTDVW